MVRMKRLNKLCLEVTFRGQFAQSCDGGLD
jgi:hypothetical protein